jgi:Ca2+-binding RTX toxin-like protein
MRGSRAVAAVALVLGVTVAPANAARSCDGRRATIVGTARSETLTGTGGRDVIFAGGGDDSIDARGGRDLVCGGPGFDLVDGGRGRDVLRGGDGSDTLHGGGGADRISAGAGAVEGLFGGSGDDRLDGGGGDFDSLIGGAGDDVLRGGRGLDTAEFWDSSEGMFVELDEGWAFGRGRDTLALVEGVVGSDLADVLEGDEGSNLLSGQGGRDVIHAHGSGTLTGGGADLLDGGDGDDILDGGEGDDVLSYDDAPAPVNVDLATGTGEGWGADTLTAIEAAIGSDNGDTLRGDADDNALAGGAGDDILDGRGGNDEAAYFDARAPVTVDLDMGTAAGWGDDELAGIENVTGSAGPDSLTGDDAPNVLSGGSGDDGLIGLGGDDTLVGGAGDDGADGGAGTDSCDAETVTACENESARRSGASWTGFVSAQAAEARSGRIAFVSNADGATGVATLRPDGGRHASLTASGANERRQASRYAVPTATLDTAVAPASAMWRRGSRLPAANPAVATRARIEFPASRPVTNASTSATPPHVPATPAAVVNSNTWVGVSAPTPCTIPTRNDVFTP